MARPVNEINAGSMADIAFLLLIFFLVTTTMDVDTGIIRRLPPPVPPDQPITEINKRNAFEVRINNADQLLFNGERGNLQTLRIRAKEFLSVNHDPDDIRFPELREEEIDLLGTIKISKGVISLQNDRGTTYEMYIQVQNELAAAVNELRNEMAKSRFGKTFDDLEKSNEEAWKAIRKAIPVAISEAEPVEIK